MIRYKKPYKCGLFLPNFNPQEPNPSHHSVPPIHRCSPQLKPGGGQGHRCEAFRHLLGAGGTPRSAATITQAQRSCPTAVSRNCRPPSHLLPYVSTTVSPLRFVVFPIVFGAPKHPGCRALASHPPGNGTIGFPLS
jgi:hypothetical protein